MSYQHAPHTDCPICQDAMIESLTRERDELSASLGRQCERIVKAEDQIAYLTGELNKAQAKVAEMRAVLEIVDQWDDRPGEPSTKQMLEAVRHALSTDCGKDYVPAKQHEALRKAAQLALDWATGHGRYANANDSIEALAEEVAPALEAALQ